MARKLRVFFNNTAQHVKLKSLNNIILFKDDSDYKSFLNILNSLNTNISIHSYILMPTYFEFVATPLEENTLSKFMQNLGRQYVWYFNKKYDRKGTLWDGRYKSSLVDSSYIFDVMKFIELQENSKYRYSSLNKNLFSKKDTLITYHDKYKELGFTQEERIKQYSELFYSESIEEKNEFISNCLEKQLVTGDDNFIKKLEKLIGVSLSQKQRGRPKKEKIRKKMYKNLVLLDKEKHRNLKVSNIENLFFAKNMPSVPVMINEVDKLSRNFPIVFTSSEDSPMLISIVSLGNGNLAVNQEGKWITNYVPIALRKYPFSIASVKDKPNQKLIMIDEESPLVSTSKGKQLFKKDSSQSELLETAIKFLSDNEEYVLMTKEIVSVIVKSGILEEREISVGEGDEKKILVSGFKVVDKEKLYALSDDILASWTRQGIITFIDSHLKSLDNINTLFQLANQRQN